MAHSGAVAHNRDAEGCPSGVGDTQAEGRSEEREADYPTDGSDCFLLIRGKCVCNYVR